MSPCREIAAGQVGWTHDQRVRRERYSAAYAALILGSHASLAVVSTLAMTFQEPKLGQL